MFWLVDFWKHLPFRVSKNDKAVETRNWISLNVRDSWKLFLLVNEWLSGHKQRRFYLVNGTQQIKSITKEWNEAKWNFWHYLMLAGDPRYIVDCSRRSCAWEASSFQNSHVSRSFLQHLSFWNETCPEINERKSWISHRKRESWKGRNLFAESLLC